jgi:DNA-binding transcriptional ArsR family regulator
MDGARLGDEFSTAVVMFHEAIGQHLGLSAADHKALGIIGRSGSLSAGELADRTGLTAGAVTGLVDRLERRGLVDRLPDPADRRRIVLSAVTSPDLTAIFAGLGSDVAEFSAGYSAADWEVIVDYLTNMIEVLRRHTKRLSAEGGMAEPGSELPSI